jgi:hypothetical protein
LLAHFAKNCHLFSEIMPKPLRVNVLPNDVYRIIEALEYLADSWVATEICRRDGIIPDDSPIHVDCHDPIVAHREALTVKRVLRRFHRELDNIQENGTDQKQP